MPAGAREVVLTLLALLVGLGVAEVALRSRIDDLSANARIIGAWPERARRIREAGGLATVLVLGNSTSREAVDAGRLRERLAEAGVDALVEHAPADSSSARDWYYQVRNHYLAQGAAPDLVVLADGTGHPLTRIEVVTEDLLWSMVRWRDLPDFVRWSGIGDPEGRAAVVVARASALYCFRGRMQKRLLVALLPGFGDLRRAMERPGSQPAEAAGDPGWVRRLDDLARPAGVRVAVVALPAARTDGRLPDSERRLAESLGWSVWEPGAGVAWTPEDLPDGQHLSPRARVRFTDLLAPMLAGAFAAPAAEAAEASSGGG